MSSRLSRLLQLLDAGSNPLIRSHAAQQIADIQRDHPQKLHTLLAQLQPYLYSKQWSTRVSAAHALELLCAQLAQQIDKAMRDAAENGASAIPNSSSAASAAAASSTAVAAASSTGAAAMPADSAAAAGSSSHLLMSLSGFSTASVISKGTLMLAEAPSSSSSSRDYSRIPVAQRVVLQRAELLKRLGLYEEFGGAYEGLAGVETLLQESDVADDPAVSPATPSAAPPSSAVAAATGDTALAGRELSARERNKAKRDAKAQLKRRREESSQAEREAISSSCAAAALAPASDAAAAAAGVAKQARADPSSAESSSNDPSSPSPVEPLPSLSADEPDDNPASAFLLPDGRHALEPLVVRLGWELLDPAWERRHGAALALRGIAVHHARFFGRDLRAEMGLGLGLAAAPALPAPSPSPSSSSSDPRATFLSDCCARLLCVLILDRFGDHAHEALVCPVRETSAQVLGALSAHLCAADVAHLVSNLVGMGRHQEGELRYGAFLGLKYVLAVRFGTNNAGRVDAAAAATVAEEEDSAYPTSGDNGSIVATDVNACVLRLVLRPLVAALQDPLDDVRGMVADSLATIVRAIAPSASAAAAASAAASASVQSDAPGAGQTPRERVAPLLALLLPSLWDALLLCDDLTASTNNVLQLHCQCYALLSEARQGGAALPATPLPLPALLQRLFPFLSHSLLSVKQSAWECVVTILCMAGRAETDAVAATPAHEQEQFDWAVRVVRLALQSVLLESHPPLLATCYSAIALFTDPSSPASSSAAASVVAPAVCRRACREVWGGLVEILLAPLFQRIPSRLVHQLHRGAPGSTGMSGGGGGPSSLSEAPLSAWGDAVSTLEMKMRGCKAAGMLLARLASATDPTGPGATARTRSEQAEILLRNLSSPHDLYVQISCLILCEWWGLAQGRGGEAAATDADTDAGAVERLSPRSAVWVETLAGLVDPARASLARARSPNTQSLLAQALVSAHQAAASSRSSHAGAGPGARAHAHAHLRLCVPPLLLTLETEQRFPVLQARAARYLASLLRLMLLTDTACATHPAVKREGFPDAHLSQSDRGEADRVVDRAVAMLCATIPPPPASHSPGHVAAAPPAHESSAPAVKEEVKLEKKDETDAGDEDDLLAMLKAADEPEPAVPAAPPAVPVPAPAGALVSGGRKSKKQKQAHDAPVLAAGAALAAAGLAADQPSAAAVAERGGRFFFEALCAEFRGEGVLDVFPALWRRIAGPLSLLGDGGVGGAVRVKAGLDERACAELCGAVQLLLHLLPHLPSETHPRLLGLLPSLARCLFLAPDTAGGSKSEPGLASTPLSLPSASLPLLTRELFVAFVRHMPTPSMEALLQLVLPVLTATGSPSTGDAGGAADKMSVLLLLEALLAAFTAPLLPFLPFLVQPVLACMSDSSSSSAASSGSDLDVDPARLVRERSCGVFAALMPLIPLESGVASPPDMPPLLHRERLLHRAQLLQLVDGGAHVPPLELPPGLLVPGVHLRQYQLDGIKWLMFLRRFSLHGILCDEMGLGKTLQAQVMLALSIHERRRRLREELSKAGAAAGCGTPCTLPASVLPYLPLPSLVLCPTTLLHHWQSEFRKFIHPTVCPLDVLLYSGSPAQKAAVRARLHGRHSSVAVGTGTDLAGATSPQHDPVVIMSYESARKDAAQLRPLRFDSLVLDEGHLLRNGSTALSRAIKTIRAGHRVILSGTPLANRVLEVWSLFDFLMPGYLGSERSFQAVFAGPITRARNVEIDRAAPTHARRDGSSASSASVDKAQAITAAGNVALEALHKRVLPFLLRRLKSDVLRDLPPKVVQDVEVGLSPLQRHLYGAIRAGEEAIVAQAERIAGGVAGAAPRASAASSDPVQPQQQMHTFQALHYLRKLCTHPALVLSPTHPQYAEVQAQFFSAPSAPPLRSLVHAPKLAALKELLVECGIGATAASSAEEGSGVAEGSVDVDSLLVHGRGNKRKHASSSSSSSSSSKRKAAGAGASAAAAESGPSPSELASITSLDSVVSGHRVLIFAQLRSTLDLIERDLFNAPMATASDGVLPPNPDGFPRGAVSYLRLDGSTPASRRFDLVRTFNADPSIDCMLLSTSVGGLGLTLTGADTCIFVEHDWNPMRDAQALDRAHRIGQRRTVHCYRLICRDSLEQRIMGLQRFKVHVANSVVNADNADLSSMDTGRMMERFQEAATTAKAPAAAAARAQTVAPSAFGDAAAVGLAAVTNGALPFPLDDKSGDVDEYGAEFDVSAFLQSFAKP